MDRREAERMQHSGTDLGRCVRRRDSPFGGLCRDLGLVPLHQTEQLSPWQREPQLANGAPRHERRQGA